MSFQTRRLQDWQAYRAIRLRALQTNPEVFCSNYAREAAWTDDEWRQRMANPRCAIWGLYAEEQLVGVTGIFLNEAGDTGTLWGSWVAPEFRGRGASELLYRARLEWARQQSGLRSIVVSHRADNEPSRRANQRHGFVLTHSSPRTWPDGKEALEVHYQLGV